jgi:hypothetical protein
MGRSYIESHYMTQLRDTAASIVESWRSIVMKSGSRPHLCGRLQSGS